MCLRFQFCIHHRIWILHFLKESQIRCTLMYIIHIKAYQTKPLSDRSNLVRLYL
jgi:hypothetical protein